MPVPTARCAACRIPIGRGQFKIDREFVFHPGCVGRDVRIETELAAARATAAECGAAVTASSRRRMEAEAKVRELESTARVATLAREQTSREFATALADLEAARTRVRVLEAELAARPQSPEKTTPEGDDLRDALSIRTSLLELD